MGWMGPKLLIYDEILSKSFNWINQRSQNAVKRQSRGNKPKDERFAVKKKKPIHDVNGS
jgi:hypothetical protein